MVPGGGSRGASLGGLGMRAMSNLFLPQEVLAVLAGVWNLVLQEPRVTRLAQVVDGTRRTRVESIHGAGDRRGLAVMATKPGIEIRHRRVSLDDRNNARKNPPRPEEHIGVSMMWPYAIEPRRTGE